MGIEEISKVTIAQQMAEKHLKDSDTVKMTTIPSEYQIHAKVFSEKEAKRFPPSREWDHRIPLKKDALDCYAYGLLLTRTKEYLQTDYDIGSVRKRPGLIPG